MARKGSGHFTGADGKRAIEKRRAVLASTALDRKHQAPEMDEVLALAREESPKSLRMLAEIRDDPNCPATARVAAARVILEYGYGRPAAQKGIADARGLTVQILHLSTGQTEARVLDAELPARARFVIPEGDG